jgi:hypothetical protein
MPTSLIVVDDFLDVPYVLRDAALRLSYPEVRGKYPGRNSVEGIDVEGLTSEVSRLVGEPLVPMSHNQAHGKFRIALAADVGTAKVHVDASHWSGILYLSQPEDCRGGTEFFRHIPTNTERAPYSDEESARRPFGQAVGCGPSRAGHQRRDEVGDDHEGSHAIEPPGSAPTLALAYRRRVFWEQPSEWPPGLFDVLPFGGGWCCLSRAVALRRPCHSGVKWQNPPCASK